LPINYQWTLSKIEYKYGPKGIEADATSEPFGARDFISGNNNPYGRYSISYKSKSLNGQVFTDVSLSKYRTSGGPGSAVYSLILPGTGTLKVTQGQKGWGRMTIFLISTGLSLLTKVNSDRHYDKYLAATDQDEINKLYDKANLNHQISLVSGGIAASIYLYDVFWVFSKGLQNAKKGRPLKNQLERGPLEIGRQPIVIK
ncbi:MAG: hypothetical protein RIT43_2439, partial [Bacteroidota bacterium]